MITFRVQRTKAECIKIASKYSTPKDWIKSEDSMVYKYASKYGWLKECCAHMKSHNSSHTKEECIEAARKHSTYKEWTQSDNSKLYVYARIHGWLQECCAHMKRVCLSHTKEECIASARKYSSRNKWQRSEDHRFYATAQRLGWLEECCAHMKSICTSHTLEECIAVAKKYSTRIEWRRSKDHRFYNYARHHSWLGECCAHMELGISLSIYTFEACLKSALKYSMRGAWKDSVDKGYYYAARRHGWFEKCCAHMKKIGHTKEECIEAARKYTHRETWRMSANKYDRSLYVYAIRHGWYEECCAHMARKSCRSLTFEKCSASARKYSSPLEWKEKDPECYEMAKKRGILIKCGAHMVFKRDTLYTKEECIASARKYSSRTEWQNSEDKKYYGYARHHNWYKECCAHMEPYRSPYASHTKEECIEAARKYSTVSEWLRSENKRLYYFARKHVWLQECCAHMKPIHHLPYTKEECIESAKKYSSRGEWAKSKDKALYTRAFRQNWLQECCQHMKKNKHGIWTKN